LATISFANDPAGQSASADASPRVGVTLVAAQASQGSASAPAARHARNAVRSHQTMPDYMRPEADPDKTDRH
jgi:hypothetical protein